VQHVAVHGLKEGEWRKQLTNNELCDDCETSLLGIADATIEDHACSHDLAASLVDPLGLTMIGVRATAWRIEVLTKAQPPESIMVGIDGVVSAVADEAEVANVLVRQIECNHLIDLELNQID
jgi:hypothetical protein